MPRYKYESPHDWLLAKIREFESAGDVMQLADFIRPLIRDIDGDTIQDLYQSDMEADGYFNDLDRPEGYSIGHDIHGYFVVEPGEEDPDEDGYSLGFDGRDHYATEEAAWDAARESAAV